MKVMFTVETCRDKVSPNCTTTFNRQVKRGRPQVNCDACKAYKTTPVKKQGTKKAKPAQAAQIPAEGMQRECPCGNKFMVMPGRGRKATKCDVCREAGIVYRQNDDGELEEIRREALAEEQREKAEQAGRERAERLFNMMAPLLAKRERQVIVR